MNSRAKFRTPRAAAAWIVAAAACNVAGWSLSALHRLDVAGYLLFFGVVIIAVAGWYRLGARSAAKARPGASGWQVSWRKQPRRWRRLFPLCFLILTILAGLGGVLHAPNNYDALAYRTPRVLHWLAEKQWHWIHTGFHRLNTRGCGMEWLTAPFLVLLRTDRFDFLINLIPFALLPGRMFGLLLRLGVRRRVAWYWMWLLPTGYGYLLQAGSIGNDMLGAWFALAAVELALRARDTGRPGAAWLSLLAAALATATKAFNVLLILPWGVAMLPVLRILLRRPVATVAVVSAGILSSIAPTAVLNWRNCGDWSGSAAEQAVALGGGAPVLHLGVNTSLLLLNNFAPPIFPFGKQFGQAVERWLPAHTVGELHRLFESPVSKLFRIDELPIEENAGLGFGVSALLLVVAIYRLARPRARSPQPNAPVTERLLGPATLIPAAALMASLVFLAQSGLTCPARYLMPFLPLLVIPILKGRKVEALMNRKELWRWSGLIVFGLAALVLVLSPARPLWPALAVLRRIGGGESSQGLVGRAWTVYRVYSDRADAFEPVLKQLPRDVRRLGLLTADDPETSLWRPFGSRRIVHVTCWDSAEFIRQQQVNYVLASSSVLAQHCRTSLADWLKPKRMTLLTQMSLGLRAEKGPGEWYLLQVEPLAPPETR